MSPRTIVFLVVACSAAVFPALGQGQSFGLGPRMSFVRGEFATSTPSQGFFGGTIRMASSKRVALEVAMDHRSETSLDRSVRHRETPVQGSILIFPVRKAFSPYLLGGIGLYSQSLESLDVTGQVVETTRTRHTGWHLGFGAEVFLTRHTAFFLDYRFRNVKFGEKDLEEGDEPIKIPGSGVIPGLDSIKLSHRGSMWTSGMAFYF